MCHNKSRMKTELNDKDRQAVSRIYLLSSLFSSVFDLRLAGIIPFAILIQFSSFDFTDKMIFHPSDSKKIEIRGIYGSPEPFWQKNLRLNELGVNSVFVHDGSITDSMMKRVKAEGLKVF